MDFVVFVYFRERAHSKFFSDHIVSITINQLYCNERHSHILKGHGCIPIKLCLQ